MVERLFTRVKGKNRTELDSAEDVQLLVAGDVLDALIISQDGTVYIGDVVCMANIGDDPKDPKYGLMGRTREDSSLVQITLPEGCYRVNHGSLETISPLPENNFAIYLTDSELYDHHNIGVLEIGL